MTEKMKTVGIITIGDDLLKGHVTDSDCSFLCKRFHSIGVKVCRVMTVPDDISEIAEEVGRLSEKFDIVVTTGGTGAEQDDITYEAIANALNDKVILRPETRETVKGSNRGGSEIGVGATLIPKSAKLIYVLPKCENETQIKGKHNGLQEKRTQPTKKKAFPVIKVKNVYVLPNMAGGLENAFNCLQKFFQNSDTNIFTMSLFLKTTEMKIINELNDAVNKYENKVIFGSFCSDSAKSEYQLKITVEGLSLDEVTCAYHYLKSCLPEQYINSKLEQKDADLVYELTNPLSEAVGNSLKVIEEALNRYSSDEIYLSFNGGKDCTVLLHLVWAASQKLGNGGSFKAIYIRGETAFPEVDIFIHKTAKKYGLKLITVFGPIKTALTELHKENDKIKGIFMGTRRTDPYASNLQQFQMCDKDWPPLMRVNPILDWSYKNIWDFLRILAVPYCSLYDEGYTSIGHPGNTQPNPALKITDNKYSPAYMLTDGSLERQGRK